MVARSAWCRRSAVRRGNLRALDSPLRVRWRDVLAYVDRRDERATAASRLYDGDESLSTVAAELGCSRSTVLRDLEGRGVSRRPISSETIARGHARKRERDHAAGYLRSDDVAHAAGVSRLLVQRRCAELGGTLAGDRMLFSRSAIDAVPRVLQEAKQRQLEALARGRLAGLAAMQLAWRDPAVRARIIAQLSESAKERWASGASGVRALARARFTQRAKARWGSRWSKKSGPERGYSEQDVKRVLAVRELNPTFGRDRIAAAVNSSFRRERSITPKQVRAILQAAKK
jgi:AraC-like DNA-binding protein